LPVLVIPGLYGLAAIHGYPELLSETERKRGILFDKLPQPEAQPGKRPVLKASLATGQIWYEYEDILPDPLEERVAVLEQRLANNAEADAVLAQAIEAATTVSQLKDALLGRAKAAKVAGKPVEGA